MQTVFILKMAERARERDTEHQTPSPSFNPSFITTTQYSTKSSPEQRAGFHALWLPLLSVVL